jgi:hypothetical protein
MNEIPAKVYYLVSTGEVLTIIITPESSDTIKETTKEEDIKIYPQLQDKNASDVDFIELEYGTLATAVNNAKSYSIDVTNKKLNIIYYTEDELNAIQKQNQEAQSLNNRIVDISNYLQNQTNLISTVENSIIQSETNNI